MIAPLQVPFLDASADALVWQLDAPVQPALAVRRIERSWCSLELRLLGASHQVLATGREGAACSELVACRPGVAGHLPAVVTAERAGLAYRFTSSVERLDAAALARQADDILARFADDTAGLIGAFPGSPHAVTAIEVLDAGWRTWHVYPQRGQIVTTTTSLELIP